MTGKRTILNAKRYLLSAKKGFTLVELMIVVGVIGLLLAVAIPNYLHSTKKTRDAKRIGDLNQIKLALELYRGDHGVYPSAGGWTGHCNAGDNWIPELVPDYIQVLPKDPTGCSVGGSFKGYIYRSNGTEYKLLVDGCMETDKYTSSGALYKDPPRNWRWATVYTSGASGW